jgi:hypothetical protein
MSDDEEGLGEGLWRILRRGLLMKDLDEGAEDE